MRHRDLSIRARRAVLESSEYVSLTLVRAYEGEGAWHSMLRLPGTGYMVQGTPCCACSRAQGTWYRVQGTACCASRGHVCEGAQLAHG